MKTERCAGHGLTALFLSPVQSHHLVLRAQDARDGLNPQTPENGVSTDVILRDATKYTQKVLTWRLTEGHIQVRCPTVPRWAGAEGGGDGASGKVPKGPLFDFGSWVPRNVVYTRSLYCGLMLTSGLRGVCSPVSVEKDLSLSDLSNGEVHRLCLKDLYGGRTQWWSLFYSQCCHLTIV